MKLTTERVRIREEARRWNAQPPINQEYSEIAEKFKSLDLNTATAEEVGAILGYDWRGPPRCDECRAIVTVAVQVGEEPDYDSATAMLCRSCVAKALSLLEARLL